MPHYQKKIDDAERVFKARKGVFPHVFYRKILACLHTDRSASDKTLTEAFIAFKEAEKALLSEKDDPTPTSNWPRTWQEMKAAREEVRARNSARAKAAAAKRKAKA